MRIALFCREFGRWKVNNLAVERRNFLGSPLPLAPEFFRNIRLLGRRPSLQQITENLIKKYGTHFLLSATLGGRLKLENIVQEFGVTELIELVTTDFCVKQWGSLLRRAGLSSSPWAGLQSMGAGFVYKPH